MEKEILRYLPLELKKIIEEILNKEKVEEIRIRVNVNIIVKCSDKEITIDYKPNTEIMQEILERMCENSIYSYQNQICQGYVMLPNGDRVGITGNVVETDGKVTHISHISSMNIRISREVINCSNEILPYVINSKENTIRNTLIVSPPGRGKTTLLRDLIRNLSNGIEKLHFNGIDIGLVDERGELAAMSYGIPRKNVGVRTDILDHIKKSDGMKMLIRTMNPKVISADEIGSKEDVEVIIYAINSGVKGIFTAHANSLEELKRNPELKRLIEQNVFETILYIGEKRKIEKIN